MGYNFGDALSQAFYFLAFCFFSLAGIVIISIISLFVAVPILMVLLFGFAFGAFATWFLLRKVV